MSQSIRGALRNWRYPSGWTGVINKSDGTPASADDAREYFMDCLADGKKVLPYASDCEGFSFQTGCPGHEVPE